MKKINFLVIALILVSISATSAYAGAGGRFERYREKKKEYIYKELGLSSEQQNKLEENRKMQRQEAEKLFTALREKQTQLREMLKNPGTSKATVKPLINQIKSLQAQLLDQKINGIFAVKEILTPEQFAKFQQMIKERKEIKKSRHEQWLKRKNYTDQGQEKNLNK